MPALTLKVKQLSDSLTQVEDLSSARGRGSVVEHHLAKVRVAGSNPVVRSECPAWTSRWNGREARQRPAKPCTRVQIPFPPLDEGRLAQLVSALP